jgi:hypothetical protein
MRGYLKRPCVSSSAGTTAGCGSITTNTALVSMTSDQHLRDGPSLESAARSRVRNVVRYDSCESWTWRLLPA